MERRRLPIALSALLSVACVEVAQIELGPDTPAGLLVLQSGDRRQVIAFEDRVRVEAGQAEAGLLLALVCPLETYGLTPGEIDAFGAGVPIGVDHRKMPPALEARPLDQIGLAPLDAAEVATWQILAKPPWRHLPELLSPTGEPARTWAGNDHATFGAWLYIHPWVYFPFGAAEEPKENAESGGDGGRRPDGLPELLTFVKTATGAVELRANTYGPDGWSSERVRGTGARLRDEDLRFAVVHGAWVGSERRILVASRHFWVAEGARPWTMGSEVDAIWDYWASVAFVDGAQTIINGLSGAIEVGADGRASGLPWRFKAPALDGWWLVDSSGQVSRVGATGSIPLDTPTTLFSGQSGAREGALATWTGDEILYWPKDPCSPTWRWPLERDSMVKRLVVTDAYIIRVFEDQNGEWRLRPDVEPPEEPEE